MRRSFGKLICDLADNDNKIVLLVGDIARSQISFKLENDDKGIEKENPYFSIPELEYIMSVPVVKKTVWDEWKQKRRTIKNDLFL